MGKTIKVDKVLDLSGLSGPNPGLIAARKLEDLSSGEILEVICSDREARRSISILCRRESCELMETRAEQGRFFLVIRRQ